MPEENEDGQEKTEVATSRRRQKAREKGSVTRSKEVNSAILLFFFVIMAAVYGPYMVRALSDFLRYSLTHFSDTDLSDGNFMAALTGAIMFFFKIVAPFLLVMMVLGVVANLAQFGWLWTTNTIFQGIKGFSLNPMKAFSKIFGKNNFVILGLNLLKLLILGSVVYYTLKNEVWNFPQLIELSLVDALVYMCRLLFVLSIKVCVLLMIIAILDYIWQRHKHEQTLKMTKQEVKDERKQMEGDPIIRAKIRGIMQRTAMERMMKNVPKADVVITNPVHVAVAISYDRVKMAAPHVVAKGARLIAERIKDIARSASVPVVENRIVAQTLFKTVDVGEEIPPKLYQAVAEILAYVYQLNKTKKERAAI
jgi:flagellar biosynthesis protein FlhB